MNPPDDSYNESIIKERIKSMREEEIIDFIRTDVIPNLNSLADRLEGYISESTQEGEHGEFTGDSSRPPEISQRDSRGDYRSG